MAASTPTLPSTLYIGLISGTSVDGVDCVLVDFKDNTPKIVSTHFQPSSSIMRSEVLRVCTGELLSPAQLGTLDIKIGRFFAAAVNELLAISKVHAKDIAAIGSHGQTVWHNPNGDYPFSMQLGDANSIAYLSQIQTVADFRRMDVAAGGQGAPLAPLLHQDVFYSNQADRAVVNIGGISNITCLPASGKNLAFDTGPGNVLMDYWIGKHQQKRYDENGDWGATGQIEPALLKLFRAEPYLKLPNPKSTGRELFNGDWLEIQLSNFDDVSPADVQATLLEFTAATIAADISLTMKPTALYVCGGGAHNAALMASLARKLPLCQVDSTAALGIHPDWVEAVAFAWMARMRILNRPIDTSAFTGATRPVILGGVYSAQG
ncbi:MAG: anhydro-N-acetylmuramic acid kinase [Pseudohongiellaceae bacterium]